MSNPNTFHKLAKDAGNRLSNYVMNFASGATAVFFLALVQDSATRFSTVQKVVLIISLLFFFATVALRLLELHIDARRFFSIAKQLEKLDDQQDWSASKAYTSLRLKLVYGSYITLSSATSLAILFMVLRLS